MGVGWECGQGVVGVWGWGVVGVWGGVGVWELGECAGGMGWGDEGGGTALF